MQLMSLKRKSNITKSKVNGKSKNKGQSASKKLKVASPGTASTKSKGGRNRKNKDHVEESSNSERNLCPEELVDQPQSDDEDNEEPLNHEETTAEINDPFSRHLDEELNDEDAEQLRKSPDAVNLRHVYLEKLGSVQFAPRLHSSATESTGATLPAALPSGGLPFLEPMLSGMSADSAQVAKEALQLVGSYQDLLYCRHRRSTNSDTDSNLDPDPVALRRALCCHVLNHAFKTRRRIIRNNMRLRVSSSLLSESDVFRDQGFSRPRVLLLLPFRESALGWLRHIVALMPAGSLVSHRARFEEEYGGSLTECSSNPAEEAGRKPADYKETFAGNTDDCFRLGISFAKKTIKLYTPFKDSDVIIASPLGLKLVLDSEDEDAASLSACDFLASIEILLMDQADVIYQQNWFHVLELLAALHHTPQRITTHLYRLRRWALEGHARFYRQTLVLSNELNHTAFRAFERAGGFSSRRGLYQVRPVPPPDGLVANLAAAMQLEVVRFGGPEMSAPVARFDTFVRRIMPALRQHHRAQVLVYVPDYLDFLQLRRYLRKENLDACYLSEVTGAKQLAQRRTLFEQGRIRVMLYSERLHFFRRFRIRGAHHLVFYGPPNQLHFFTELCQRLEPPNDVTPTCRLLVHRVSDAHSLRYLLGPKAAVRYLAPPVNSSVDQ